MKPKPIWKKWLEDPKKREKLFTLYWISMVFVQLMLIIGFIMFVVLYLRR